MIISISCVKFKMIKIDKNIKWKLSIYFFRLQLELSYNWHFQVSDQSNDKDASKIFSVADFVGDLCKAMASKIRGAVSSVTFDDFHKHSATIIQKAVFGIDLGTEKESDILIFKSNNLCVTSVDIK